MFVNARPVGGSTVLQSLLDQGKLLDVLQGRSVIEQNDAIAKAIASG